MTSLYKRGPIFHYRATVGGKRYRFSLGVRNPRSAKRLMEQIEYALADGPKSETWDSLRTVLPPASFALLTKGLNLVLQPKLEAFRLLFSDHLDRRVRLGEIADSSRRLYEWCAANFFNWLAENSVRKMDEITARLVDDYLISRKEAITKRGGSARGLATESSTLAAIFNLAIEGGVLKASPLKHRYRPDVDPRGSEPFTPEEMEKLAGALTRETTLPFLICRWTALRGGDVADLTWDAIDFTAKTLRWQTRKRGKWVTVPLASELIEALAQEQKDHPRGPTENVLPYMTRAKLYQMMINLGKRAGVPNSNPHRFRDSLACTILENGGTMYDVAKILGDEQATCEAHYTPFTQKLQDRVRGILEGK